MNDHFTEMLNGINTQVNSNRQEMRDMAERIQSREAASDDRYASYGEDEE